MTDEVSDDRGLDPSALILIVTGAHLIAERHDRPLAYGLCELMESWLDERFGTEAPRSVLVCSDVWYLNDQRLRACPAVSIGGPEVNALSAYLADKLPTAFTVDDVLAVQLDVEMSELLACVWGIDSETTAAAVEAFVQRYLPDFMEGAAGGCVA